jgi:hypothetical protein
MLMNVERDIFFSEAKRRCPELLAHHNRPSRDPLI